MSWRDCQTTNWQRLTTHSLSLSGSHIVSRIRARSSPRRGRCSKEQLDGSLPARAQLARIMKSEEAPRRANLGFMLRALQHRNFALFFSGQIVSLVGTWLSMVATSWLVYRLTRDAEDG